MEDDPDIASMVRWAFGRLENSSDTVFRYALLVVSDGKKAIQNIRETSFDLILLDISLPIVNGFDVLIEAKKCRIYTPIFMFSGSSNQEDVHYAYYLGANGYILKSGAKEIQSRLAAVCNCYFNKLLLPYPRN